MDVFDKLSNYIEELEQGGKQARARVVELVDEVKKLEEENKTLKEKQKILDKENCELIDENVKLKKERDLYKARNEELNEDCFGLSKENKKLKEERIFSLGEYDYMILTSTTPQLKIIKKNQNYSLMEEDTLQELRDIGEIE